MAYTGKLLGALLGFLAARLPGALVGLLLGHQFDRGFTRSGGTRRRRSSLSAAQRQQVFFETTFLVIGHVAKADGRVSEVDIAAARQIMQRMRLGPDDARLAIDLFTRGKQPGFPLEEQLARFARACAREPELQRLFLEIQLEFVLADGAITTTEREVLSRVAEAVGVGRIELLRLEARVRARSQAAGPDPQAELDKAYEVLGVPAAASDREVKVAYRRLMNEHHPDKQAARGLPPALVEMAEERTREIRAAYDLVRERRGMR
jgi:DnaJ like chaperone protein